MGGWFDDGRTIIDYFHCAGIKHDDRLVVQALMVKGYERLVELGRENLARMAIPHRRTERQFYEGDDAPAEYEEDDDEAVQRDTPGR